MRLSTPSRRPFDHSRTQISSHLLLVTFLVTLQGMLSQSYGQWSKHTIDPNLPTPTHVFVADIDGDGDLDVAATSYTTDLVVWYENGGDNLTWTRHTIDNSMDGTHGVHVADINGDGYPDVVSAGYYANAVVWYQNNLPDTSWTRYIIDFSLNKACWINVADFDGDMDLDVVAFPYSEDSPKWYENKGGTPIAWTVHPMGGSGHDGAAGAGLRIVDMDGDSDPDVMHATANEVFWYENDGGTPVSWTRHIIADPVESNRNCRVGDLDGDSDPDVVITTNTANKVVWYENGGDALSWTPHIIDTDLQGSAGLDLVDLDDDTDLDIVAAGYGADAVVWYRNNLPDTSWTRYPIDPALDGPANVKTADIGGNGLQDVIVAGQLANAVMRYEYAPGSAWGKSVEVSPSYVDPVLSTLHICGTIENPLNHPVTVWAKIEGIGLSYEDSVLLYDDGAHGDGAADDDTCGGTVQLSGWYEGFYEVTLRTRDENTGWVHSAVDRALFTTAGPVVPPDTGGVVNGPYYPEYRRHFFKLALQNLGSSATVSGVTATVSSDDPRVDTVYWNLFSFGNIAPGAVKTSTNTFSFIYAEGYGPGNPIDLEFDVVIYSDGTPFWRGTIGFITGVEGESPVHLPRVFSLGQNYPNPFNPSTTICYELPRRSHVTLSIFNALGQKVATLADEVQEAGYKSVEFDASNLPSGIYLYRIRTDGFMQTRKMILLR